MLDPGHLSQCAALESEQPYNSINSISTPYQTMESLVESRITSRSPFFPLQEDNQIYTTNESLLHDPLSSYQQTAKDENATVPDILRSVSTGTLTDRRTTLSVPWLP